MTTKRAEDGRVELRVDNTAVATARLREMIGTAELSGIYRRGPYLVYTPRVGEEGYIPPDNPQDDDGPAQVQVFDADGLAALVDVLYAVGVVVEDKKGTKTWQPRNVPQLAAKRAHTAARMGIGAPNVRTLRGTTHTPVLRPDGSVLDQPGYDSSTGLLYLPAPGLAVPPIPERPTPEQLRQAVDEFLILTAEFPFVTVDHRAGWHGLAMTPLVRPILPPPYQFGVFTAPNPRSGKGFLAKMIRDLHGGVFRSEWPRDAEEQRKAISGILRTTTAPVVQFDNVRGVIRSSVLEGLLTSAEWSDRTLGKNEEVPLRNDRLWIATGNNAQLGGDMAGRLLMIEIDPKMPDPHTRTGFKIHPPSYVPGHRGQLLAAMLTLARGWVLDGQPAAEQARSDDYMAWYAGMGGLLTWAGIPGTFGGAVADVYDPDAEEWAEFLVAIHGAYGDRCWTVKELTKSLMDGRWIGTSGHVTAMNEMDPHCLPGELAEKLPRTQGGNPGFAKSLGWWFKNRAGRYAHGWKVEQASGNAARKEWKVISPDMS